MALPEPAELARTSVARARVAALITYPRSAPARPHLTSVAVACDGNGSLVVRLGAGSIAAAHLISRPMATVRVAPLGSETVTVHGAAHRLRDTGAGQVAFRVEVGAVRLGAARPACVDVAAYCAAEPDPLRHDAPAVLAHLRDGHAEQLAACLRAHGHDIEWAEPSGLDRYGITVLGVGPDGVATIRLSFPAPVRRLADLSPGLGCILLCRCGRESSTSP